MRDAFMSRSSSSSERRSSDVSSRAAVAMAALIAFISSASSAAFAPASFAFLSSASWALSSSISRSMIFSASFSFLSSAAFLFSSSFCSCSFRMRSISPLSLLMVSLSCASFAWRSASSRSRFAASSSSSFIRRTSSSTPFRICSWMSTGPLGAASPSSSSPVGRGSGTSPPLFRKPMTLVFTMLSIWSSCIIFVCEICASSSSISAWNCFSSSSLVSRIEFFFVWSASAVDLRPACSASRSFLAFSFCCFRTSRCFSNFWRSAISTCRARFSSAAALESFSTFPSSSLFSAF
mmetsp:Transcript_30921/g.70685  ORF Transcript_30921/g.70685 Transcript_30921/m.70685 type:complete len:293 (-) Transcript_30921:905-1783(-)